MSNSQTKKNRMAEWDAAYEEAGQNPPVPPEGNMREVLDDFVEWLKTKPFVDAALRTGAGPGVWRIVIWPKLRPAESMTLVTLWFKDKCAVSVLGLQQDEFNDSSRFETYLKNLITEFRDGMNDIEARFKGDADGMLRFHSPEHMTMDDASVIIPHEDFVRLAEADSGELIKIRVDTSHNKRFDVTTSYKYLTAAGHVLELEPHGVRDESGIAVVSGRKRLTEQIAA